MCEDIPSDEYSVLINKLLESGFDAILTTNYSYDIEKTLDKDFSCKIGCTCKYRKNVSGKDISDRVFGLHKYMSVAGKKFGIYMVKPADLIQWLLGIITMGNY